MKASEITVNIHSDDKGIERYPIPTDCIPSVGDHVWLDGVEFACTSRAIEIQHGMATFDVTLQTVRSPTARTKSA